MTIPNETESQLIFDSSKIDTFLACNRRFFYEHVLGWRPESPNNHLHFGTAWHIAMEHLLLHGYDTAPNAYNEFLAFYRSDPHFSEETDELYCPKDPTGCAVALAEYAMHYSDDLDNFKVLHTEVSGSVPIAPNRSIYFKMDSILQEIQTGEIFSLDHKTAKRFGRTWEDKFFLAIQNGTYTHVMKSVYDPNLVKGVEFNGVSFEYLKRGSAQRPQGYNIGFQRVPAFKSPDSMLAWLWNINTIIEQIEREFEMLDECKESDNVLTCFPLNPTACTNFFGCPYHNFCLAWSNPLRYCDEVQPGFVVNHWNPLDEETTEKFVDGKIVKIEEGD
jgi:hypothetical protein